MIQLLLSVYDNTKTKVFIFLYFLSFILLNLALILSNNDKFENYFNYANNLENYHNILTQVLGLIIPFICLVIVVDHDQDYINNLTTFKSRSKIYISKVFTVMLINFIHIIFILTIYLIISNAFNYFDINNLVIVKNLLSNFIDCLLISFLIIFITKKDNKIFSYFIIMVYVFFSFLISTSNKLLIFYIFPVLHLNYSIYQTKYLITYQILYLIIIFLLGLNKYLTTDIN